MRNKLLSFCLIAWILTVLPLTVSAQEFDPDQEGSISVTMVSANTGYPVAGAELSVYYVATVDADSAGNLVYRCTDVFDNDAISLTDPELVSALDAFVLENTVDCQKIVTDSKGSAACGDLPLGLYFIKQTGEAEGFAPCVPFLVTVPMATEDGYQYHVDATPKIDVVRLMDITIEKVWNTDGYTEIPQSVTIQLRNGEKVVETATLNDENGWQITYTGLPESDGYNVQEVDVPQGFTATYTQTGYEFTVINTASLAYTGQIIWPIPVFAMFGIVFLTIGFVILRKPGKHHG